MCLDILGFHCSVLLHSNPTYVHIYGLFTFRGEEFHCLYVLYAEPCLAVIFRACLQPQLRTSLCSCLAEEGGKLCVFIEDMKKRSTCDMAHSQSSQMPIPAMWKMVHFLLWCLERDGRWSPPDLSVFVSRDKELWVYC